MQNLCEEIKYPEPIKLLGQFYNKSMQRKHLPGNDYLYGMFDDAPNDGRYCSQQTISKWLTDGKKAVREQ